MWRVLHPRGESRTTIHFNGRPARMSVRGRRQTAPRVSAIFATVARLRQVESALGDSGAGDLHLPTATRYEEPPRGGLAALIVAGDGAIPNDPCRSRLPQPTISSLNSPT